MYVLYTCEKSLIVRLKIVIQGKGGVMMFGGCIADRVVVNEEEIALADVRGVATVQFSPNSACRCLHCEYSHTTRHIWGKLNFIVFAGKTLGFKQSRASGARRDQRAEL